MKKKMQFCLHGFTLSNRCECKVCGLVFVVSIHAFAPRLEMGVSHQMLGVKSAFSFGGRLRVTCLRVTCPGTLCLCSVHESLFYWCCRLSETLKRWRLQLSRLPLGPEESTQEKREGFLGGNLQCLLHKRDIFSLTPDPQYRPSLGDLMSAPSYSST